MPSFKIIPASALIAGEPITTAPGVYCALFPEGRALLKQWGYRDRSFIELATLRGHPCLYIGSTVRLGLNTRLRHHTSCCSRQSTLRGSLGLLLAEELDLTPVHKEGRSYFHFGGGELRLTDWIGANVLFAYKEHPDARAGEHALIERMSPALNLWNRQREPFVRKVMLMRRNVWASL